VITRSGGSKTPSYATGTQYIHLLYWLALSSLPNLMVLYQLACHTAPNGWVTVHNMIVTFTYYSSAYSPRITGGQNEGQKRVRIQEWNLPAL
jgi:hypothetical protein